MEREKKGKREKRRKRGREEMKKRKRHNELETQIDIKRLREGERLR